MFIHSNKSNNEKFKKASSNIPKLAMLSEKGLNVRDLMTFDKIFIEKTAIELITKRLTWKTKINKLIEKIVLNDLNIIKKQI